MEVLAKTKKKPKSILAKNIVAGREKLGMNGIEFAEIAKIPYPTLRDIEADISKGRPATIAKIASALSVDEWQLSDPTLYSEPKNQEEAKVRTGAPLEMVTNQRLELITLIGSLSDSQIAALLGPVKNLIRLKAPINKDKPGS